MKKLERVISLRYGTENPETKNQKAYVSYAAIAKYLKLTYK